MRYVFLMPTEAAFAEAVADHMYPADNKMPGSVDIGIPGFIDRALAGSDLQVPTPGLPRWSPTTAAPAVKP